MITDLLHIHIWRSDGQCKKTTSNQSGFPIFAHYLTHIRHWVLFLRMCDRTRVLIGGNYVCHHARCILKLSPALALNQANTGKKSSSDKNKSAKAQGRSIQHKNTDTKQSMLRRSIS